MEMQIVSEDSNNSEFYENAKEYWAEIPATIDGMLGGFASISQRDIKGSKLLLKQLFHSVNPPENKYALDCGAGIGRITKHLLVDLFEKVDLVDQNRSFLDQAEKYIGPRLIDKIGNFYCSGLQDFIPEPERYDVIWMQWVLGHLTHADLVRFFEECKKGLKPNGVIIVKENVTSSEKIEMDLRDSSCTRPLSVLKRIFKEANLECYRQLKQHDFPRGLYSVYMFVLKPIQVIEETEEIELNNVQTEDQMSDVRNDVDTQNKENASFSNVQGPEEYKSDNVETEDEIAIVQSEVEYTKENAIFSNIQVVPNENDCNGVKV